MARRAHLLLRPLPHYRRGSFEAGLVVAGFEVTYEAPSRPSPDDVVVIWNRYGRWAEAAAVADRAGSPVVVCENGYLGCDANGLQHYAMAVGGHNGSGRPLSGDRSRWDALGIPLQPWRAGGEHIVVRAQRGIGTRDMASPPRWHLQTADHLRRITRRPIVIREHPARAPGQAPLDDMLRGAHALVTWASSDAGRALVAGIPVFYAAPHLVCGAACRRGIDDIEAPLMGDRLPALTALAWAQFSIDEIATGWPFRRLLGLD